MKPTLFKIKTTKPIRHFVQKQCAGNQDENQGEVHHFYQPVFHP